MTGLTATIASLFWLSLDLIVAQPTLDTPPKYVVPNPGSPEGLLSTEALSRLAPCQIRILSMAKPPEDGASLWDPVDDDVIHFVATAYNEMDVAYSVLRLERAGFRGYPKDVVKLVNLVFSEEETWSAFPNFIRRYKRNLKKVDRLTKQCSAVVSVSDTSIYLSFLVNYVAEAVILAELLWDINGPSTALLYLNSPRDGRLLHTLPFNNNLFQMNAHSFPWKYLCALEHWSHFECISRTKGGSFKGNLQRGAVVWSQHSASQLKSDNVILNDALPVVCQALNATLIPKAEFVYEDWTIGPGLVADLWDTSSYGYSIALQGLNVPLKWTETDHQVSFLFVGDALNRKLSALIEPMDGATWALTSISALAVSVLSAAIVTEVKLRDSLFDIFCTLLCQGRIAGTSKWHLRSVLAFWLLATVVIVGGYTGLLFSALTSPEAPWFPKTLSDLTSVYEGDVITSAVWKETPRSVGELKELGPKLQVDFFILSMVILFKTIKGSEVEQAWLKQQGGEMLFFKLKHLNNDLTDLTEAQVDSRAKSLNFVDFRSENMEDQDQEELRHTKGGAATPYWLPASYVYLGHASGIRLYQLVLQTLGMQKFVSRAQKPINFLSKVGRWSITPTHSAEAIEGKLGQLAAGGFLSMWTRNATSWDAVHQIKSLQGALRLKSFRTGDKAKRLSLLLNNFITQRNLMVHLFNDFASSTSVNLQTVDWSVRRLSLGVLEYVFQLFSMLGLGSAAVLVAEFLVASVRLVDRTFS